MCFALLVPAVDLSIYFKNLNSDQERICLTQHPRPDFFVIVIQCLYKYSAVHDCMQKPEVHISCFAS